MHYEIVNCTPLPRISRSHGQTHQVGTQTLHRIRQADQPAGLCNSHSTRPPLLLEGQLSHYQAHQDLAVSQFLL